jgi:hypothetical protein
MVRSTKLMETIWPIDFSSKLLEIQISLVALASWTEEMFKELLKKDALLF